MRVKKKQKTKKNEIALLKNAKNVTSPLAVFFVCILFFIFVLNLSALFRSVNSAKEKSLTEDGSSFTENFETNYMENFVGRETYVGLNGALAKPLEQVELNEVIKLHNGYLTLLGDEVIDEDLTLFADNMLEFEDYLADLGVPFAYVQAPYKLASDDDMMLPNGYTTFYNQNADNFLEKIRERGITTLDLRDKIQDEGLNHYDLFFRTDHHWSVYGGFWSHKHVANLVDSLLGEKHFVEEYYDLEKYDTNVYKNFWLGSLGKRTGEFFGGLDDLPVITPTFETDIRVVMEEEGWDSRGSFAEAFLNAEKLESNPYGVYLTSDLETNITNYGVDNDTSVFVLKDSFALVMAPFLSLYYNNVYLYDLRLDTCTPENLVAALEEVDPDVVLCFYNPSVLYEKTFTFLPE